MRMVGSTCRTAGPATPCLDAVSRVSTHARTLLASELAPDCQLLHFQIGSERRRETVLQKLTRFSPIAALDTTQAPLRAVTPGPGCGRMCKSCGAVPPRVDRLSYLQVAPKKPVEEKKAA